MKSRRIFILGFSTLCLVLFLPACFKLDTEPQLLIRVLDEKGAGVSGAYVALFENQDEWSKRINPVQVWRRTDPEGRVIFEGLQPAIYYIYARYDGKDNSTGEIATHEALRENFRHNIIVHIR